MPTIALVGFALIIIVVAIIVWRIQSGSSSATAKDHYQIISATWGPTSAYTGSTYTKVDVKRIIDVDSTRKTGLITGLGTPMLGEPSPNVKKELIVVYTKDGGAQMTATWTESANDTKLQLA